ncbi:MAG: hypothetical protein ABJA66_00360 [Actinomycetota bacterium]
MLRSTFQDRNDELSIYQKGFTYKSRKGLQTCLWNEIADSRKSKWVRDISDIKTENGEWINFANAMQGLDNLTEKLNKHFL